MNNSQIKILHLLRDDADSAYVLSTPERRILHEIEFNSDGKTTILGEVEIISDAVFGVFSKCQKNAFKNSEEVVSLLTKYSVFNSPILVDWLIKDGKKSPHFAAYLKSIENLRLTLKEFTVADNAKKDCESG